MRLQMPRFRFKDPNSDRGKRKKDFKKIQDRRKKKKETDDGEIERLRKKLWPDFSENKEEIQPSDIKLFTDLPLSKKTMQGLDAMKFSKPTDIQRESLLYALKGHDILGAAKTGSGKTLAFLIPILETLFRQRYTPSFGMAALVISPTRELAYQSYDVLRKFGRFHSLSFGLAIGGMFLREEAKKMNTTNVVICTPGRLLQHFEQTPNFTADELKVLVLDEADKILDLGFAETLNSIVEALPKQRQTLLFSATQTKSVKSLARLSLKKPIYVSVHEKAKEVTPTTLNQRYIVCDIQNKVNMLWSFIKSHKMKKMLVFLSSCKEVRYLYQVFKKMHPGLTVLCLHGHMKQLQRMEAYELFSRKKNVVMLATDVAARGLDFPLVHWVVQVDKPENVDTYIHRVGRTARYDQVGEALLMLMPSEEEKMVEDLKKRKIPVVKLKVAKKRMFDVTKKLENYCASDQELKNNAQKAFISVMKTLFVLDKASFNQVDTDAYAASLGLVQAPKLPFLTKAKTTAKVKSSKGDSSDDTDDDDEGSSSDESEDEPPMKKRFPAGNKKTLDFNLGDNDDEDDDIYNVVRASTAHLEDEDEKEELNLVEEGRNAGKKKTSYKKKIKLLKQSKLITFDEDGNPEGKEKEEDEDGEQGLNIAKAVKRLREEDKIDKEVQRQRVKQEHREKRLKEKQKRREATMARMGVAAEEEGVAVLGSPDDDENNEGLDEDNDDYSYSDDEEPQVKRRKRDDDEDNDDDGDDSEEDSDGGSEYEDEESDNDEMNVDDDDDEDEESGSDEEEGKPEDVEQDEAAVLALLGGKR